MDEIIKFNKSLQQRLEEYLDVLSDTEITVSKIKKKWSFYLELSVDPNGWQAIWKIPRITCELYNISFPTIVLVYVECCDFQELTTVVKILAVQDDISLPDKHSVPLTQLWPTKEQDKSIALNMQSTAEALDMFRFFYNYVIMPWDYDDDKADWLNQHLESRLRLFYDMRNGTIPKVITEHLSSLLTEARQLHSEREQLNKELDDIMDINGENGIEKRIETLMEIHVRLIQIRNKVEILENPLMRNVILKRQQELIPIKENSTPSYFLILDKVKVDEHVAFLNQVKMYYPNELFKFSSSLTSILENVSVGDTVILGAAKYTLTTPCRLEHGGFIKGIFDKNPSIITSTNEELLFDFNSDVVLESCTVLVQASQCGVLVRSGNVNMTNCKLVGVGKSDGINVLGGHLELINCDISNFYIGIVGNSGSKITMKNCEIHDINFGIKIYDECNISIENANIYDCCEHGICVETDKINHPTKIGNFDILQNMHHVTTKGINGKGDVMIVKKPDRTAFAVSESEDTENESNEEMDELNGSLNNTVIENNSISM